MRVPKNFEDFCIEKFIPNHEASNLQNSILTLTLTSRKFSLSRHRHIKKFQKLFSEILNAIGLLGGKFVLLISLSFFLAFCFKILKVCSNNQNVLFNIIVQYFIGICTIDIRKVILINLDVRHFR